MSHQNRNAKMFGYKTEFNDDDDCAVIYGQISALQPDEFAETADVKRVKRLYVLGRKKQVGKRIQEEKLAWKRVYPDVDDDIA